LLNDKNFCFLCPFFASRLNVYIEGKIKAISEKQIFKKSTKSSNYEL